MRVRAVIIKDSKILIIKRIKEKETYWVIPGGGVEVGESLIGALKREIKEELSVEIVVGELIFSIDSQKPETLGQKEYFYLCSVVNGKIEKGNGPEFFENSSYEGGYEIEWVEIEDLGNVDLRPNAFKGFVLDKINNYL